MIASITSNLLAIRHPGDHVIRDWQEAGLLRPSSAQARIATVEPAIIDRRLGWLSRDDLAALYRGLREALGLARPPAPSGPRFLACAQGFKVKLTWSA
jgi:mRNA interferase MazF